MKKILIIQTASIGDVILATPLLEKLHDIYGKEAQLDILIKDGNQNLFTSIHTSIRSLYGIKVKKIQKPSGNYQSPERNKI